MLITVLAGNGAPGATTSALALGLAWPRAVLVADLDLSGGAFLTGYLSGRTGGGEGLYSWAVNTRHNSPMDTAAALGAPYVLADSEHPDTLMLSGVRNRGEGRLVHGSRDRIAASLDVATAMGGRDVICDMGRWSDRTMWEVLRVADHILVVTRCTARSYAGTSEVLEAIDANTSSIDKVRLLAVEHGDYSASEISTQLKTPMAGTLPWDTKTAPCLSDGAAIGLSTLTRSKLMRHAQRLAATLTKDAPGTTIPTAVELRRELELGAESAR